MFERIVRARPRIQLTVRQRTRVLDEWPPPGHRGRCDLRHRARPSTRRSRPPAAGTLDAAEMRRRTRPAAPNAAAPGHFL